MSPARRPCLAAVAIIGVVVLTGCGGSSPEVGLGSDPEPGSASESVEVVNIAYSPETLEIAAGTEVRWTNEDESVRHTVTSGTPGEAGVPGVSEGASAEPDGIFDGDLPDASSNFSFTFDEAGTFAYFCAVHPSMIGEVVVR